MSLQGLLYDDGLVALDEDGVLLRRYYFPFGTAKRIAYGDIRRVEQRPLSWSTGKGRLWGSAGLGHWMPLDRHRVHKQQVLLLDVGGRVTPAFTPDDPERVLELLRLRTA